MKQIKEEPLWLGGGSQRGQSSLRALLESPSEQEEGDRPPAAVPSSFPNSPRPFTAPAAGVDREDSLVELVPVVLNTRV